MAKSNDAIVLSLHFPEHGNSGTADMIALNTQRVCISNFSFRYFKVAATKIIAHIATHPDGRQQITDLVVRTLEVFSKKLNYTLLFGLHNVLKIQLAYLAPARCTDC